MSLASEDPLIGAVLGKLPALPGAWSKTDRIAWLRMFMMAADVAYGVAPGISVSDVEERVPLRFVPDPPARAALAAPIGTMSGNVLVPSGEPQTRDQLEAAEAAEAARSGPRFLIDADGFAMGGGLPIDPEAIPSGSVVHDQRQGVERGDYESILWKTGGVRKVPPTHFKLEEAA